VKDYPIDQEVRGMQTIKLNIPLYVPDNFEKQDKDIFDIPLAFFGPKQNSFGQQINLKVQVTEGERELSLYNAAITLTEAGMGTFDECIEALRKCNFDENAALQVLVENQSKK